MNECDIFMAALDRESPGERTAFLDTACAGDAALRARVEALLRSHGEAGSLLEHPAVDASGTTFPDGSELAAEGHSANTQPEPSGGSDTIPLDFLTPSDDPQTLGRVGNYAVTEVIGRGGMGIVLKARDASLDRVVAIKVLAPELAGNATARKRFLREARTAAAVTHQHVVTIHAVGEDRLPYLVMECVSGQSLQDKLDQQGPLELREVLRIGTQVASGLAAAHAHGVIHRDIKPANILLENGIERVRLTDFGLARAVDDVAMTRTGEVAGTPQYMSPEQAQGQPVDARSDLFSFGSVLYAMCTGRPPFRAETTIDAIRRVCDDAPRPIREINAEVPEWLTAIIDRLLAKRPEERFQTAQEVAQLLGKHLAHVQDPGSTPFPAVTHAHKPGFSRKPSLSHRWVAAAVVLCAVLATLGVTEATGVTRLTGTVVRIVTGEGTLIIEIDDPTVQVSLDGEELTISGGGVQEVRLRPGQYQFVATKHGQPVKQELVTITRGDKRVVTVSREAVGQATASPVVAAERGAFVVLGGGGVAERKFDTLAESVDSASDGDTIEIRGSGPFVTEPITLRKALTMRAGVGFQPTLQLDPRRAGPLLTTESPLVLEGIEFLHQPGDDVPVTWTPTLHAFGAVLQVANCRFFRKVNFVAACVYCSRTTRAEFRNSQFTQLGGTASGIGYRCPPMGTLLVENCAHSATIPLTLNVDATKVQHVTVRLRNNTWAAGYGIQLSLSGIPERIPRSDPADAPLVTLESARNVFGISDQFMHVDDSQTSAAPPPQETLTDACRRFIAWRDEGSLYPSQVQLGVEATNGWPVVVDGQAAWDRFWNQQPTAARSGTPKFQGGELYALTRTEAQPLGPEAFRLHRDSPGYRAGSDGKDLGADMDLVGPGAAYERWKKTPEYQQWLEDTGQIAEAAASDVEPLRLVRRFAANDAAWINAIRFAPDGASVVTASPGNLDVWDVESGQLVDRIELNRELRKFDFSADGLHLVGTSFQGSVMSLDWPSGDVRLERTAHQPRATDSTLLSAARVATTGHDGFVRIWDAETGAQVAELPPKESAQPSQGYALAASPDGRYVVVGGNSWAAIWDVSSGTRLHDLPFHPFSVKAVAVSPDGRHVLTGGATGRVQLFQLDSGEFVRRFDKHANVVLSLEFLADSRHFVSGAMDGSLRVWSLDGEEVARHESRENNVSVLRVSPDGCRIVSAGGVRPSSMELPLDATLQLWELPHSLWPDEVGRGEGGQSKPTTDHGGTDN